jgi:hypothetical protein
MAEVREAPGIGATASNVAIAGRLDEMASLLQAQGANPYRVDAYRKAAATLRGLAREVGAIHAEAGTAGLDALPTIGPGIAAAIAEMLATGRWSQLDRLRGELDATAVFRLVPGLGPALAARIHDTLHVDTLEALEAAAHDGRLQSVPGVGVRRAQAIGTMVDGLLAQRRPPRRAPPAPPHARARPPIADVLDVDREYRERAAAGSLRTIAPKRFNPSGEAWLPVLQTTRGDWHFTALYSNTELAHRLGRTHDWVVIFFYDHDHVEQQCTVVTETRGSLEGRRVVRGREADCLDFHGHVGDARR